MTTAIVRESLTYEEGSGRSFFLDLARASRSPESYPEAVDRLAEHQRQMRVLAPKPETHVGELRDKVTGEIVEAEYRFNPNSVDGTGGEFAPPMYLTSKFASAGRAGRPYADLLQPLPLPAGTNEIHIPRMSTGSATFTQIDGTSVDTQDIATTDVVSPVVTIAGDVEISMQLLEQSQAPGFDVAAFIDLNRAYNRNLEAQLISGTGANGQVLGVANVSGINTVAGSGGTTIATLWPLLGQAGAAISNNRLLRPEVVMMAGRRWFWIASSVDSSSRPIASPHSEAHLSDLPAAGGELPIGSVVGVTTYTDGAITAQSSADNIYFLRPSDMFLWESTPRMITAPNPLSGTLQMRLSLHKYVAFSPHRYPNGIAVITSVPQPSGF